MGAPPFMSGHAPHDRELRVHLANEAARIMVEDGISDYRLAKRKAAEHLRVSGRRWMPANDEIERAAREYQRLFRAEAGRRERRALCRVALEAMHFLERFNPRLVGPLLAGIADRRIGVCLHLFVDPPERAGLFLLENGIRYEDGEQRARLTGGTTVRLPVYRFLAGDTPIELVVFCDRLRYRVPLVDGRPLRRAKLSAVEALAYDDAAGP